MSNYRVKKGQVRALAIEWQYYQAEHCYSLLEIMSQTNRFERLGKRYGLLKEFRENGII